MSGACQPWVTPSDLAGVCTIPSDAEPASVADVIEAVSWALYRLSGSRYRGTCTRRVRPCRSQCACWMGVQVLSRGHIVPGMCIDEGCGCGWLPTIDLAVYPVQSVDSVAIDGVALDVGAYRLDRGQYLARVDGGAWPVCQNMSAGPDDPGSFTIDYTWGTLVPVAGKLAAAELACEMWAALYNPDACRLPARARTITRQGVTIENVQSYLGDPAAPTGLALVDLFLSQAPRRRRSTLYVPGMPAPVPVSEAP